jgi:hypothetical protein
MAFTSPIKTGVNLTSWLRVQSVASISVEVPGRTQIVALFSSEAGFVPEAFLTMKPVLSQKLVAANIRPRLDSRVSVQLVFRNRTSTSPDCRAVR